MILFTSSWWALALRGLAAILFGILAFIWPGITLTALVFLFGAYALVDGAFAIVAGIRTTKENKRWWLLLIEGILSVFAGVLAFVVPAITGFFLLDTDRIVGDRDRRIRDCRCDSNAQGDYRRMDPRPEWRRFHSFWIGSTHLSCRGSVGGGLDYWSIRDSLRRVDGRSRIQAARPGTFTSSDDPADCLMCITRMRGCDSRLLRDTREWPVR